MPPWQTINQATAASFHVVTMNRLATNNRDMTVRMLIGAVGVAFLLAGLYGFYDPSFLGIFALTATHNWIHVVSGLLYMTVGFTPVAMNVTAWVARVGGVVYALLGVVGFFAPNLFAPFMVLGANENVFHVVIGVTVAVLGFMLPVTDTAGTRRTATGTTHRR